jgi:polyisoprenyl-teichoic acid--peptidoglycan teichoic acid transferase
MNKDVISAEREKDQKSQEGSTRLKKILLAGGIVLVLLLAATVTYVLAFYNQVKEPERVLLPEKAPAIQTENGHDFYAEDFFSDQIVNIALLGFDRGWNREALGQYLFRPDMLAVMSINFSTDQISVVRIPRDSYVPIHGMSGFHDKINHSFFYGYYYGGGEDRDADGIQYTLKTVSNVLGDIPIHYYVSVDMYSIIELVDAVGGIYFEVEETIYDKHWNVGAVLVPEGPQVMDGKTYLRYLQYRDDQSQQDFGRIDRQMDLLKHTFFYLREEGKITDIPKIYRLYRDFVDTDLSYKQIAALTVYGRDFEVNDENLRFYTIRGGSQTQDGIWYSIMNQKERVRIIEEVFGLQVEAWSPIKLVDSPEYLAKQERLRRFEQLVDQLKEGNFTASEKIEMTRELWHLKRELDIDDEEFEVILASIEEADDRFQLAWLDDADEREEGAVNIDKHEKDPGPSFGDDGKKKAVQVGEEKLDAEEKDAGKSDEEHDDDQNGEKGEDKILFQGLVIPDVRGLELAAAEEKLKALGLEIGAIIGRHYLLLPEGKVIQCDPFSGSLVEPESKVNIIYSLGPPPN